MIPSENKMTIYQLGSMQDKKKRLKALGVHAGGVGIMADKMDIFYFHIKSLKTPAANILKQDALSIGADLAVPSGVVMCEKPVYDCILIATKKQLKILAIKELSQPFGLKAVAEALEVFLKGKTYPLRMMGVMNINEDSFFEASRCLEEDVENQIESMIASGADIIDIGAVSSRPHAIVVGVKEELSRIKPIADIILAKQYTKEIVFSIDSTSPEVIAYALQCGFTLINDISGASNPKIIALAVAYGAKLCIMHMQGTPQTMQENPSYGDVIIEVSQFFERRIEVCEALGLSKKDIILDVGIGFGKTLEHNISLIQNMAHFKKFGCEVLVGASRKSMIDKILPAEVEARLPGTLAIHLKAVENGANIVRCHDIKEHKQAFAVQNALIL